MADDPGKPASPTCFLDEANDLYRGYLAAAEIQQLVANWRSSAPSPEIAAALALLLDRDQSIDLAIAVAAAPVEKLSAAQLLVAINAMLPKIRDDKIHLALQDIASKL
jgi:hypothetical protein